MSTSSTACRNFPALGRRGEPWRPRKHDLQHLSPTRQRGASLARRAKVLRRGTVMDFRLPELGEGVYEAELVAWLAKPGDVVKRGQNLMEVLTDKASMEVPAPFAGTIKSVKAEPGQRIKVGDVVLTYDDGKSADTEPP